MGFHERDPLRQEVEPVLVLPLRASPLICLTWVMGQCSWTYSVSPFRRGKSFSRLCQQGEDHKPVMLLSVLSPF